MIEAEPVQIPYSWPCGCEFLWVTGEFTAEPCSEAHAALLNAILPEP